MTNSGSGPAHNSGAYSDEERHDRLAHSAKYSRGDERRCGHEDLVSHPQCAECAFDLGKRSGHAEAGAYYTWAEVKARLDAKFGGGALATRAGWSDADVLVERQRCAADICHWCEEGNPVAVSPKGRVTHWSKGNRLRCFAENIWRRATGCTVGGPTPEETK